VTIPPTGTNPGTVTAFVTDSQSQSTSGAAGSAPSSNSNIGVIVGGAVGGAALLAIVAAALFICLRNKRRSARQQQQELGQGPPPGGYMQQNNHGQSYYVSGPSPVPAAAAQRQPNIATPAPTPVSPVSPALSAAQTARKSPQPGHAEMDNTSRNSAVTRHSSTVAPASPREIYGTPRPAGHEVEANERQQQPRSPRPQAGAPAELDPHRQGYWWRHPDAELE
jgi:hypothetical protein